MTDRPLTPADRLRALADEAASEGGLFVLETALRGHAAARVVEVFVESETGAGADDLAAMSRRLGFLIETDGLVSGAYRLDVSTPGAERPLTDPRQFRRHVGRPLSVRYLPEGDDAEATVEAALAEADDEAITLGEGEAAVRVPYDTIREARVRLPW